ncbi:MAG: hypothetical protein ABIB79_00125 [archaeon]
MLNKKKKGQVGIEYLIVVSFVTFAIVSTVILSFFYSAQIQDRIKLNQVENFAVQLTNSAESVFFAGEPSKTTVSLYLPEGVASIQVKCEGGGDPFCLVGESYFLMITVGTSSGEDVRAYESRVPINGTISPNPGTKKLILEAKEVAGENFVEVG